jgi:hypothetical protein
VIYKVNWKVVGLEGARLCSGIFFLASAPDSQVMYIHLTREAIKQLVDKGVISEHADKDSG